MVSAKLIVILLVTLSSHAFTQLNRLPDRTTDESEILRSIAEISRAYVARDPEPFLRIYLENYVYIREKPVYNMREQLVAMMKADSLPLKAGKKLEYETLSYESENPQFHFYGHTAIVNISKKNLWRYRGSKCLTRTQATELWIKRDGTWRIAAGHVTTFHCDPKPYYPTHTAVAAIGSITKAPPNVDLDAEGQVRSVFHEIAVARSEGADALSKALDKNLSKDFIATNLKGEVVRDRSILTSFALSPSSRSSGLRNQDNAILIYGDTALFTFRIRPAEVPAGSPPEAPQQCTIVLVKSQGKWQIAAAHVTKDLD